MKLFDQFLSLDRRDTLMEVLALAALVDGGMTPLEMQTIEGILQERPEFSGLSTQEAKLRFHRAAIRVHEQLQQKSIEQLAYEVSIRLSEKRAALLAFGLAAILVLVDDELHPNERELLSYLEVSLDLSEDEVNAVLDCVTNKQPIETIFPSYEEKQRALVEVMALVAACDGRIGRPEIQMLLEAVRSFPEFAALSFEVASQYLQKALDKVRLGGVNACLEETSAILLSREDRVTAYLFAVLMALCDEMFSSEERTLLLQLRVAFELTAEDVQLVASLCNVSASLR